MHLVTENIEHIIQGCQQYQPQAQKELYMLCYADMLKVCMRYTVNRDDAAAIYNEAMLKALQNIGNYTGSGSFMGWVRRIVVNTAIDHCRKQATYKEVYVETTDTNSPAVESIWEDEVSSQIVLEWLQLLPKNTALVFNMYCLEGYEIAEVAEQLHITVGTAKWHVNDARKRLRENLQQYNNKKITANA